MTGALTSEQERWVGIALALAAAAVAATAGAEPTSTPVWDQILAFGAAGAFVLSAKHSPTWLMIIVATVAAVLVRDPIWTIVAGLGLVAAVGTVVRPRAPLLRMLAAALTVQGLLRLASMGFFGLPSLIAGIAFVAVWLFGVRVLPAEPRRRVVQALFGTATVVLLLGALGGGVLLTARTNLESGITAARSGVAAARGGEPAKVVDELERASRLLSKAEQRVNSPLATPLRLIPVASQHLDIVRSAVRHGTGIADLASLTVTNADISSVRMTAGSVDLSALSEMEPDLTATAELLETAIEELADKRTGWLARPIGARVDDLAEELADLAPETRVAADAASVVPGLLGQQAPRRYFIAFGTPAESRELGGFIGSWALVELDQGNIDLIESARVQDLYELTQAHAPLDPALYTEWFAVRGRPHQWPQNITHTPDLATVAAAAQELFDGLGGGPIEGFIYLDSIALAAMLNITGPIELTDFDQRLTADNAAEFFLDGQYRLENRDELKDGLGDAFAAVFERLTDKALPGPEQLGRILGPAARGGHLQVATFDDEENSFFRSIRLQRNFDLLAESPDGFAVVGFNGLPNKLDQYLDREVSYDVSVDDDGHLTGKATVTVRSSVPDDAPEEVIGRDNPGLSRVHLSLYTPHLVDEARIDGSSSEFLTATEFGYLRAEAILEIPPGQASTVEFDLVGRVDPNRQYSVMVWNQPLANNDSVELSYTNSDGGPQAVAAFDLVEHTIVTFD